MKAKGTGGSQPGAANKRPGAPQLPAFPRCSANALVIGKAQLVSNGSLLFGLRHRSDRLDGGRGPRLRNRRRADHAGRVHLAVAAARLRRLEGTSRMEVAV